MYCQINPDNCSYYDLILQLRDTPGSCERVDIRRIVGLAPGCFDCFAAESGCKDPPGDSIRVSEVERGQKTASARMAVEGA